MLPEGLARVVEAQVLPGAGQLTTARLREKLAYAVIAADPEAAERRRQEAERNAEMRLYADDDQTATLLLSKLPQVEAAATFARVTALARARIAAGMPGTLNFHRVQVAMGLLNQTLPLIPPADGAPPTSHHPTTTTTPAVRAATPVPGTAGPDPGRETARTRPRRAMMMRRLTTTSIATPVLVARIPDPAVASPPAVPREMTRAWPAAVSAPTARARHRTRNATPPTAQSPPKAARRRTARAARRGRPRRGPGPRARRRQRACRQRRGRSARAAGCGRPAYDGLDDRTDDEEPWDPAEADDDPYASRPVPDWPALGALPPGLRGRRGGPADGRPVPALLDALVPWPTLAGPPVGPAPPWTRVPSDRHASEPPDIRR